MMQNLGNRRSVQKCAQNAGSNVLKLGRSNAYFCNFRPPPPFWYTLNKSHIAHIAHSRNSYSREKLWLFHNVDIEKKNLPIENWIVPLFIYKILSPLNHTRMFGTKWIEIGSVVMEKKIFKFFHSMFAISLSSSLRKGRFPLSELKLESPSPKDALY